MARVWKLCSSLMRGMRGVSSGREKSMVSLGVFQTGPSQFFKFGNTSMTHMMISRRFSCDNPNVRENLSVVTQAEFCKQEDMRSATWMDPVSFLEKHPAVIVAHKHNKMIAIGGTRALMLSGIGRTLWHSLVQLVFINKLRGHDIAKGLLERNLHVSPYGTFALKNSISDPYDQTKPFMGFKALESLFCGLMKKIYGPAVLFALSLDVDHFLKTLIGPHDDRLCLYHAVFLSPTARALLSIRLHSLVRCEVNLEGYMWSKVEISEMLQQLPYLSSDPTIEETDNMHIIFRCLRDHGEKRKARDAQSQVTLDDTSTKNHTEAPDKVFDEEAKKNNLIRSGYSIVGLNRNAVLHRVRFKDLQKLAEAEKAVGKFSNVPSPFKGRYCLWEIVQLLHFHMPMLLPVAQRVAMGKDLWKHLEMGVLWPRDEIFHNMTSKRIGPTPSLHTMFTYYSDLTKYLPGDPNNSKIFVGGLCPTVNEEDLKHHFGQYGEVVYVRILNGKNCGFVELSGRTSAEEAIEMLNGTQLGRRFITLSFAHGPAMKKVPLLGGHYAHPQTYDTYAWAFEEMKHKEDSPQIQTK